MKSLKEFKAAFKIGESWSCYNSNGWKGSTEKTVIRTVGLVQTNAVAFNSNDPNRPNMSWLYWPKANQVTFINNNGEYSVRVENEVTGGYLIYKKVG